MGPQPQKYLNKLTTAPFLSPNQIDHPVFNICVAESKLRFPRDSMQLTCTWWFVFSLYLVIYQQYKVPFPNQMTITGALMEYAAILLLLKKRRRPVRSVDEGLKSVLAIVHPVTEK